MTKRRWILLWLALFGLIVLPYRALAVTANSVVTPQTPNRGLLQFLNASTPGTYATLYTAAAAGSKCNAVWADTNDPATHTVACQIVNGGLNKGGFSATTTAATATTFTQVSLMPTGNIVGADSDGNPFIQMITGDTLQCTFQTTITSPDQVDFHANCGDF